jgi:hypothetical protein
VPAVVLLEDASLPPLPVVDVDASPVLLALLPPEARLLRSSTQAAGSSRQSAASTLGARTERLIGDTRIGRGPGDVKARALTKLARRPAWS